MNWKMLVLTAMGLAVSSSQAAAGFMMYQDKGTIAPTVSFTGQGADVEVYFYGDTASYRSNLTMYVDGVQTTAGYILPNHSSAFGETYDLGFAPLGSNIVFALQVFGYNNVTLASSPYLHYVGTPIYTVYSDPSLNSIDHINHVYSTTYTQADSNADKDEIPVGTYVAFEDLLYNKSGYAQSDLNYNDHTFVFVNVGISATPNLSPLPEPTSAVLLSIGALSLIGFSSRRRK